MAPTADAVLTRLGVPLHLQWFAHDELAAWHRVDALRPAEYARSRNALDGAVSGLSPYLAHGLVSMPQVVSRLLARHRLDWTHKLVFEFAWREYYQHVWHRAGVGPAADEAILHDMAPSVLGEVSYQAQVPADLREARTGVPAIDAAVRVLYRSGYLHNHARMWLASYAVHVRKTHWRAGADWMLGHLLDGDLASNHLSWQWVAGTFSSKPYLFNAENVARYAPAHGREAWLSPGTAIDRSYEALDHWARAGGDAGPERGAHAGMDEPCLSAAPASEVLGALRRSAREDVAGREVEIVHPWALAERDASGRWRIAWIDPTAHAAQPWSARRWAWVRERMGGVCDAVHVGPLGALDLTLARSVRAQATLYPGYRQALNSAASVRVEPSPRWLSDPPRLCPSFSRFYQEVQRQFASPEAALAASTCPLPQQVRLF